MKKNNKKGFTLIMLLIFTTIFTMIFLVLTSYSYKTSNSHYVAYKKIQAINYAEEGIELIRGYYLTEVGKDKIKAWARKIQPLSGKYTVSFSGNEYLLIPGLKEIIEVNEPYVVDYIRTITITSGDTIDEKKLTVTVDYGEKNKVSFETSLYNLYGQ